MLALLKKVPGRDQKSVQIVHNLPEPIRSTKVTHSHFLLQKSMDPVTNTRIELLGQHKKIATDASLLSEP